MPPCDVQPCSSGCPLKAFGRATTTLPGVCPEVSTCMLPFLPALLSGQLILSGDFHQLPPVAKGKEAAAQVRGRSGGSPGEPAHSCPQACMARVVVLHSVAMLRECPVP